jgi:TetR/AcrR family transcriptional regulator
VPARASDRDPDGAARGRSPALRRGGRPRLDRRPLTGDPTGEILAAAARLFQQRGIESTTMSGLAAEVGLKQSSLYYYFPNRDAVVAALVAQANVVPLQLIDGILAEGGSAGASVYRFVRGDVEALCALPFDINEIHRVATRDRDRFADYWRERARLERRLAGLVSAGTASGEFRPVDARLTALTIMSNDEGVQNWFRLGSRRRPRAVGDALAAMVVGGLLAPGRALTDVLAEVSTSY